jgi:hypothetical protein
VPVKPATPGGRRYFLLLIDDATRYMWVALLVAKTEAVGAIRCIKAAAGECGRKLSVLRTDNGGEFTATSLLPTTPMRESHDTSQRRTPCNRTGSWSGGIKRWWRWRALL